MASPWPTRCSPLQGDPFNFFVTVDSACPTCRGTGQVAQWSVDGITYRLAEPLRQVLYPTDCPVKILNCTCMTFGPVTVNPQEN